MLFIGMFVMARYRLFSLSGGLAAARLIVSWMVPIICSGFFMPVISPRRKVISMLLIMGWVVVSIVLVSGEDLVLVLRRVDRSVLRVWDGCCLGVLLRDNFAISIGAR